MRIAKSVIVALIRDRLGMHTTLDEGLINRHMDLVQDKLESGTDRYPLPWFLFNETVAGETVADSNIVPLPSEFLSFDDDWPVRALNSEGKYIPLCREQYYILIEEYKDADPGFPEKYAWAGNSLVLFPTPDDVYTLDIPCYTYSTVGKLSLATDGDTPKWFDYFAHLIVTGTALSIANAIRDEAAVRDLTVAWERELDSYRVQVEARRQSQTEILVGTNN